MEELDIKSIFNIFWKSKVQIILIILIFVIIGAVYSYSFITPMYTTSTSLVLATDSTTGTESSSGSITTTDITLNSKLVSTYSVIVNSKDVLRQVISNLGMDISEEALKNNITVSSVKDTEVIKITVTNLNPSNAAKIANEVAKVFSEKVGEIYNINNIHVLEEAEVPGAPSNINHTKDIMVFAEIGAVVAIAYVLIANMLDTTVKSSDEIEQGMGATVLVSIPICSFDLERKGK